MRDKQQAIARCVEVSTADTLTLTTTLAAHTIHPTRTIYESIIKLCVRCGEILGGLGVGTNGRLGGVWIGTLPRTHYCKMMIWKTSETPVSVTGTLAAKLGFAGVGVDTIWTDPGPGGQTYIIAANYPDHMWIADHYSADDGWFIRQDSATFSGSNSNDGKAYGFLRNARPVREAEWQAERSVNVIPEAGTPAQRSRCLLTVCDEARGMILRQTASGNPYCKGVFLINDLAAVCNEHSDTRWKTEDHLGLGRYKFCSILGLSDPTQLSPNSRDWYSVSVSLISTEAPIFWFPPP